MSLRTLLRWPHSARIVGAIAAAMLLCTPVTLAQAEDRPPDLVPVASSLSGWSIVNTGGNGRQLRVTTQMGNAGQGAFEMRATSTFPTATTRNIVQRVYQVGGTFADRLMGAFVYHSTDTHLHVEGWEALRLRLRPLDNSVGAVVAQTETTSLCAVDTSHFNPALPGSPSSAVYTACNSSAPNGISIGWSNIIGAGAAGQAINITCIPSGNYWLEQEVDPHNHIFETPIGETNNIARIAITLTGLPAGTLCRADFDCSGGLAIADIFFFLNTWFAGSPIADFDGMNGLQIADIFAFLNAWFAGC